MGNRRSPFTHSKRALRYLCVFVASAVAATVLVHGAGPRPRLVVLLVVDQMRADYVDRFMPHWSASGFRRLVTGGAWFTEASYPYMATFTCAGHATIATGALPREHGIFQNTWYDRTSESVVPCTNDPSAQPIRYSSAAGSGHHGPAPLRLRTLADEMRTRGARVVSLALKARSAIALAGHGGMAVTWLSESLDGWETSTAFTPAPVPQVAAFVAANPIAADFGQVWNLLLPPSAYGGADEEPAEMPPPGWSRSFPHDLSGTSDDRTPGHPYAFQWQHSPYADAYVARMAVALAKDLHLGSNAVPDLLAVSFSSPDLVGHLFGPRSRELQDMYFRLDGTLGAFLTQLDTLVGPGNYTLALTSDHGVSDIPEQVTREPGDSGRLRTRSIQETVELALSRALGPGPHTARVNANDVYLKPGVYERLVAAPDALHALRAAVTGVAGVADVFTRDELAGGANATDARLRAAALSYVAGRSGDLVVVTRHGWLFTTEAASHGSFSAEERRVPIILFGSGVKPGRYARPVTPADLAPTLASIAGVPLPRARGRVLSEALR